MRVGTLGGDRATRMERSTAALLLLAMLVALPLLVHPWYDATADGTMYLHTAKAMAAGDGYSYLGRPFHLRAPGYPALLIPFVRGENIDFRSINLLGGLFGVACVVLLYFYNRRTLGWVSALAAAVVIWVQPGFQRVTTQVMSDGLGGALLMGCLLLERGSARSTSWTRHLWLGVAVGVSTYVRIALVILIPAIILAQLLARREPGQLRPLIARLSLFAAAACVLMAPWALRNHLVEPPSAPTDQTKQYSASTHVWNEDPGDPASPRLPIRTVLERIPRHASQIMQSMATLSGLNGSVGIPRRMLGALLSAALLIQMVRRRDAGSFFVVACLLTVSAFRVEALARYLLPAMLVALPAAIGLLHDLLRRPFSGRVTRVMIPAALLVWIALDFEPRADWELIEAKHHQREEVCAILASRLKETDRVAAFNGAELGLLLDRPVYILGVATRRLGIVNGLETIIRKYNVNCIVIKGGDTKRENKKHSASELRRWLASRHADSEIHHAGGRPVILVRIPASPDNAPG